eukprot:1340429-Rhodomonas_salina.1
MTKPIEFVKQFLAVFHPNFPDENKLDKYLESYGNELNTGIVGQTIKKHIPSLKNVNLFWREPFRYNQINQSNFVLLSMPGRRNKSKELYLNVFIGLTDHYPGNFVSETGIEVDMHELVDWETQNEYGNHVYFHDPSDDDYYDYDAREEEIKQEIFTEYFGPNRTQRFYHVIVFKLNLEVFEKEEYEMLWYLVSAQHSFPMILPRYSVTPAQIISMIEKNEKRITWKKTQHRRFGNAHPVGKLPPEISSRISEEAGLGPIQRHRNTTVKRAPTPPNGGMDTWQQPGAAWAMSQHRRLSENSAANVLPPEITRRIAHYAHLVATHGSEIGRPNFPGQDNKAERSIPIVYPTPPYPFPQQSFNLP